MPSENGQSLSPKVFVLALDGGTFDLLHPWMEQGELPNLRALYRSGVHGPLESTYPPLTGPAWASFMTGKRPENHSLLEFFGRELNSYRQRLHSRLDIDGRSIWRVLSDSGKRVGVLSVPLTYPPEPVNGFLVTGLLTPRTKVTFTHPPELEHELNQKLGRYLLQHTEKYLQDDPSRLINEEWAIMNNKIDAALYLMESRPWDFFMLHILGTDVLQHAFWHYFDPNHIEYNPNDKNIQKYGNVILKFWRDLDKRLGEVFARLDENTYVMVMSDHGFGPLRLYINFNIWLLREGFMHLKRDMRTQLRWLAFCLGFNYRNAVNIGFKTGLARRIIQLGRARQEEMQRKTFLSLDDVDWSRTTVYSMGNFGQMYVNLKGREPEGIVAPGAEYEAVLTKLEARLRALRDPYTGEPVVERIWRGAELYQGKYAHKAPDLFFFTRGMLYKAMGLSDFGSNTVFEHLYGTHAHHHMNGIFMLKGPGIPQDVEIDGAHLIDLAPTIYHLMGVPIPRDVDGQVLTQALGQAGQVAPQYETGFVSGNGSGDAEHVYTAEEEAALTEMLRDLGYVS